MGIIVCGAWNGLAVLPVVLSLVGWEADVAVDDDDSDDGDIAAKPAAHAAEGGEATPGPASITGALYPAILVDESVLAREKIDGSPQAYLR